MEKKGKMRNGVSEKKRKGPSLAARMVPNMGQVAHTPRPCCECRKKRETRRRRKKRRRRKNDEGEATQAAAESQREREGQEENREGGEKGR